MSTSTPVLTITLKDTHENAQKLCEYFNTGPVRLAVADLDEFINRLISLYSSSKLEADGKAYVFTSTLFQEALYSFIEFHWERAFHDRLSYAIMRFITLIYVGNIHANKLQRVGDMLVVTIPTTNYTFRLNTSMLPAMVSIFEDKELATVTG